MRASKESQVFVTTHSEILAQHIEDLSGSKPVRLAKRRGETVIADGDRALDPELEDGSEGE